jgi:hypothetical protein
MGADEASYLTHRSSFSRPPDRSARTGPAETRRIVFMPMDSAIPAPAHSSTLLQWLTQ